MELTSGRSARSESQTLTWEIRQARQTDAGSQYSRHGSFQQRHFAIEAVDRLWYGAGLRRPSRRDWSACHACDRRGRRHGTEADSSWRNYLSRYAQGIITRRPSATITHQYRPDDDGFRHCQMSITPKPPFLPSTQKKRPTPGWIPACMTCRCQGGTDTRNTSSRACRQCSVQY